MAEHLSEAEKKQMEIIEIADRLSSLVNENLNEMKIREAREAASSLLNSLNDLAFTLTLAST